MNMLRHDKSRSFRFALLAGCALAFLWQTAALASSSVILAWDANPEPDIAGYRIYSSTVSGNYNATNDVGNVTTTTLSGLTTGMTYYFAATAYNTSGLESDYSNEISFTPVSTDTNNPPVISLAASMNAQKETATAVTSLSVADADVGSGNVTITLAVDNGTLFLSPSISGGLTSGQITGNGSALVTTIAPLTSFNSTVNNASGLRYTGNLNFIGTDTLAVTANDNTGSTGAQSSSKSMTILVAGNAYDQWLSQSFNQSDLSNPSNESSLWGELADPDADGQSNLLEFAVGSDPTAVDLDEKVVYTSIEDVGGQKHFSLTFKRRKNQSLVQYLPEVSSDQESWVTGGANVQQIDLVSLSADFELVTYQDLTPISTSSPRFFRLRVVMNEN